MSLLIKTIPFVPMSRNARDRAHWAERDRELSDWTLMIPMAHGENKQAKNGKRRRVEIVFRKARGPKSDPDNLVARAKVPLDALVKRDWLFDDSEKYVKLVVREEVTGKRGQTVIAVSDFFPRVGDDGAAKDLVTCPDGTKCEHGCRGGCYRVTYGAAA